MTSTFDANTRTRTIAASKATSLLIVLALAIGAILLALSAPVVHAAPNDGPVIEPSPPYAPSDQFPSLALPPVLAEQNPVVFYGVETEKDIDLTWTPYKWGPVQFHYKAVGGTQYEGYHPPVEPSVADPWAPMEITYGRTYQVYLKAPYPSEVVGPTLTITTVRVELASTDPPPPRVNPTSIPGANPHPDPPGTQRLAPGAAARNTTEDRSSATPPARQQKAADS